MRKNINQDPNTVELYLRKELGNSLSTQQSPRPCMRGRDKQKSQLCKKFIENGCCPYQNKCKFAHGLHELKNNQLQNSKYKTKECGCFLHEGFCIYGNRCNFIHPPPRTINEAYHIDDLIFKEMKQEAHGSRLLKIIQ